jgi:hypothetical protein
MDRQEFERYKDFYYLVGTPTMAGEALAFFLDEPDVGDLNAARSVQYFFARLAELNPPILRQYEALIRAASPQGRAFILRVFEQAGDEGTRRFLAGIRFDPAFSDEREQISRILQNTSQTQVDVLHTDIRDVGDLDLLWTEFSVTASKVAVLRVIQVLEWPDRIRTRLDEWLRAKPSPGFLMYRPEVRRKQAVETLAKVAAIVCDLETGDIANREDLDCLCYLDQLGKRPQDQIDKIRKALPFSLSTEDVRHIAIRTTAIRSLSDYAKQHDLVREVCEENLPLLSNRARLALLEILGRAYLDIEDFSNARARLSAYCEANPAERKVRESLRLAQAEERLEKLSQISLDAESIDLLDVEDGDPDARRCITATQRATSYRSWLTIRDLSRASLRELDFVLGRWRFTYVQPDRFHVSQVIPWFWQDSPEDGDIDEWISVGMKHFQNVQGWISVPGEAQTKVNSFLTGDKYLALMRNAEPTVVGVLEEGHRRNLLFEYDFSRVGDFFSFDELQHWYLQSANAGVTPISYTIPPGGVPLNYHHLRDRWGVLRVLFDANSALLLKAYLVVGGEESSTGLPEVVVEQIFASHGDGFRVDAPTIVNSYGPSGLQTVGENRQSGRPSWGTVGRGM